MPHLPNREFTRRALLGELCHSEAPGGRCYWRVTLRPWATAQHPAVDRRVNVTREAAPETGRVIATPQQEGRRSAMNIVVLVKQVPDSGAERNLRT